MAKKEEFCNGLIGYIHRHPGPCLQTIPLSPGWLPYSPGSSVNWLSLISHQLQPPNYIQEWDFVPLSLLTFLNYLPQPLSFVGFPVRSIRSSNMWIGAMKIIIAGTKNYVFQRLHLYGPTPTCFHGQSSILNVQ